MHTPTRIGRAQPPARNHALEIVPPWATLASG